MLEVERISKGSMETNIDLRLQEEESTVGTNRGFGRNLGGPQRKSCLHRMYSLQANYKFAYSGIGPEQPRYVARANNKNKLTF